MKKIMKRMFFILSALMTVLTMNTSCSDETEYEGQAVGQVRLNLNTVTSTNSRALDVNTYNPKQLAVKIVDADGNVVKETDDHTEWTDKDITLPVGHYTVTASSNGFDGNESGFDIPYYSGSASFDVAESTQQTVSVTCTLATVKVTVKYTDRFKKVFSAANVKVSSSVNDITPLNFVMSETYDENVAGYFPVGNITAEVSVTSKNGDFSSSKTFENVKARDHIIITYDVSASGSSQITVLASANGNTYTYDIDVADFTKTAVEAVSLASDYAGYVWDNKATLLGTVKRMKDFNAEYASFEYKAEDAETYTKVQATQDEGPAIVSAEDGDIILKADVEGLNPGSKYVYRLVYNNGVDEYVSPETTFETEEHTPLPNGNMDEWYKKPAVTFSSRAQWFACSETYYKNTGYSWWDSSNRGTTEGAGWFANVNPTTEETTVVHTAGGKSAKLASTQAVGVFAAASLYAGRFNKLNGTNGAILNWGRPFTSRPKALHGWYRYSTAAIDYVGAKTPESANIVKDATQDLCSAYIALVHVDNPLSNGTAITVDNTDMKTFPDWETDNRVVAYAELPVSEAVSTGENWKEMNLVLNYHNMYLKPTHIIIVFSASKYGDYFTGSTKSVLYLDDFELTY